ncbi:ATP-binding protein [Saccharopolyspora taberi]|uniref:LuxR family transcriptional regulator n=1 Tax=Saccharopolyspora taberi TaxID=60895 RepID=A0ABN3VG46_9PSEU
MTRSASERRSGLPADTTSFVGRRQELGEVKRLLSAYRLTTLTGPGGVGKTRLALRAAADVRRAFHDQVWFADLAGLREPDLVPHAVAEALDLHEQSARPVIDTLVDRLDGDPLLLVLDNCEHLVDACASLVHVLMQSCPNLRVLATSRQSLGLVGECTFAVPPFQVPDPERVRSAASVARFDSVRLFLDRAAAVAPEFEVTDANSRALARICHDLDGIPLAIELAVARLRSLSLAQIAERITERHRLLDTGVRGLPPRQRTLRALIDWSYELCSEPERRVWARASVFSGSFDLDAVEHVVSGARVPPAEVLGLVDSLVDKSIFLRELAGDRVRYRMLETTRAYGEEKLTGQETARRKHRDWFARLAERFAAEWTGPDQAEWITRLRREHHNIRVALDFCAREPGEAATGLRTAIQLVDYWTLRGYLTEARMWLDRLLPSVAAESRERMSGLVLDGWFALHQGEPATARRCLADAQELAGRVGNVEQEAYLRHVWGMEAMIDADLSRAGELFEQSHRLFQEAGTLRGELFALFMRGLVVGLGGEPEKGRALLDTCVGKTVRIGDVYWRSYALWSRSAIDVADGRFDDAERSGKEALSLEQTLADRSAMTFTLETLAWVAEGRGQHVRAATLFGIAGAMWAELGGSPELYSALTEQHHKHVGSTRSALGEHGYERAFDHGFQMSPVEAVDFALESPPAASAPATPESPLTRRELEIAELVAEGMTNRDIANRLVISHRTAEGHVENILTKLGFTSRSQIAAWVISR